MDITQNREEIRRLMRKPPKEVPYLMRDEARLLIEMGEQTLVPFGIADAPVTFSSRWALAKAIDNLIVEALYDH